jgi:hypothetical protein
MLSPYTVAAYPHLDHTQSPCIPPKRCLIISPCASHIRTLHLLSDLWCMYPEEQIEGLILEQDGGLDDLNVGAD